MERKTFRQLLATAIILTCSLSLFAQVRIGSPYSRYGVGDLSKNNSPAFMSLGGSAIGMRSSSSVDPWNPASYTAFDSTSFIFEGGLYGESSSLKTVSVSQTSNYSSIGTLLFGFPVTRRMKASFGLMPFSSVGYKVAENQSLVISPDSTTRVKNIYAGDGGINKVYFGLGYQISKNLSIGANAAFLFGTINRTSTSNLLDETYALSYMQNTSIRVHDFSYDFGMQYTTRIGKDSHFTLGAVYTPAINLKSNQETLNAMVSPTNNDLIYDTIYLKSSVNGTINIPKAMGAGFSFEKENKFLIAGDVYYQEWSKYKMFDQVDSMKNSLRASLGLQIIPDGNDYNSYFKRVRYRMGVNYQQTYLQLNNKQLTDFGVSFGVGLPLHKGQSELSSKSTINLGIEIGKRGTTDFSLIKENYIRFTISLSLYDTWFRQLKFY